MWLSSFTFVVLSKNLTKTLRLRTCGLLPGSLLSLLKPFVTTDCEKMANKAQELGAIICVPPTDIPDVGRFSVINDPQGATFSIIEVLAPAG